MRDDLDLADLSPEHAHPRARSALTDRFFWDAADELAPFGSETGAEAFIALRDYRDENPQGSALPLLEQLLARWEVVDGDWDVVDPEAVHQLGAEDEYSLLTRDETILALAFGDIVLSGRLEEEIRRRALVAITRQSCPALLHGFGGERAPARLLRLERMRAALSPRWD